jgi:hypothetical protein
MPTPGEYKTVQARILAYAQEIGWTYVPGSEAEKRRGSDHSKATPADSRNPGGPVPLPSLSAFGAPGAPA